MEEAGNAVVLDCQSVAEERMAVVVVGAHSSGDDDEKEVLVPEDGTVDGDFVVEAVVDDGNDDEVGEEEEVGNDAFEWETEDVVQSSMEAVSVSVLLVLAVADSFLWQGLHGLAMADWLKRRVNLDLSLDLDPFDSMSVVHDD